MVALTTGYLDQFVGEVSGGYKPSHNNDSEGFTTGQQRGAVGEAHRGAARLGAGRCCRACWLGRRLVGFVVVIPVCSVVPVSL